MGGLRVIGGICKGRKLKSVRGITTRPTADRMRESLFNIIASKIPDAMILDLFAGTGALGIEALSRGAKYSVFIENNNNALSIINENILLCQMSEKAKTIQWDIVKNLKCIESANPPFDIVFIDPPYKKKIIKKTIENLRKTDSLKKKTDIIVEHSSEEVLQEEFTGYRILDQRKYGKTTFSFLRII